MATKKRHPALRIWLLLVIVVCLFGATILILQAVFINWNTSQRSAQKKTQDSAPVVLGIRGVDTKLRNQAYLFPQTKTLLTKDWVAITTAEATYVAQVSQDQITPVFRLPVAADALLPLDQENVLYTFENKVEWVHPGGKTSLLVLPPGNNFLQLYWESSKQELFYIYSDLTLDQSLNQLLPSQQSVRIAQLPQAGLLVRSIDNEVVALSNNDYTSCLQLSLATKSWRDTTCLTKVRLEDAKLELAPEEQIQLFARSHSVWPGLISKVDPENNSSELTSLAVLDFTSATVKLERIDLPEIYPQQIYVDASLHVWVSDGVQIVKWDGSTWGKIDLSLCSQDCEIKFLDT